MDPSTLLNKPKPRLEAKITRINNLVEVSTEARKSSTKLVKVFEKGTYQKKTQLTVLNRYKKRLESIQKQNDRSFKKKRNVKIKLPDIKKYVGNFFTPGSANDPMRAIGTLAAFNALQKSAKGDFGDAFGPALMFAGIALGPSLLKRGISAFRGGGQTAAQPTTPTSSPGLFRGTPYAETRAGKTYASMQQFRNLPKWAQGMSSSSASRFAASNERIIQGTANIGDKLRVGTRGMGLPGIGGIAENIAGRTAAPAATAATARTGGTVAAKAAGVGARAIPLLGTALNIGLSAYRFSQGDVVGGILSAVSAIPIIGWAALGIDVAREFGAFDGTVLGRKGSEALKNETEKQKREVEKKKESTGELTFRKTLLGYERVVNKFQEFAKNFQMFGGETLEQTQRRAVNIENLLGDQDIIDEPGYEFTNYTAQYLTGDPNSPAYDESHGTSSNYHDHIAFNDRDMAIRAYQYLESKGLDVTEFQGFDPVGGHSNGSYHYSGLAFDVPGYQWGATGPIDQRHYNGSRIVRKYLNEFFQQEKQNNPNLQSKGASSQRARPAAQARQPMSTVFQRQQPAQGLSIGRGGFNIGGRPVQPTPQVSAPSLRQRDVARQLSYQEGYSDIEPTIVPYPVMTQSQPRMMAQESSAPMLMGGPSEEQLLNSFYKKVLLNSLL